MPDQEQAAKSAWIKSKDKLPTFGQTVFAYNETQKSVRLVQAIRKTDFDECPYWQRINYPAPPQFDEQGELKQ